MTPEAADEEILQILDLYSRVYEELLAVPVVKGRKTEKEKFAGGAYTTTVEGYIPATGRGIQGGTSHSLGQNFSRMFGIAVEDPSAKADEKKPHIHVWQNSWGLSTRTLGVMTMIHGDNRGLVLPPRVAEIQVVIVPVGLGVKTTDEKRDILYTEIEGLLTILTAAGIRATSDIREGYSPGWKFNTWELRGVPLRIEFGPSESAGHFVTIARRDIPGKDGKLSIPIPELSNAIPAMLETIQSDMFNRADAEYRSHRKIITNWDEFIPALNEKNFCIIPFCLIEECEDQIKDMSTRKTEEDSREPQDAKAPSMGAKSLCIPFDQPDGIKHGETKCANPQCTRLAEAWCMFGRKSTLTSFFMKRCISLRLMLQVPIKRGKWLCDPLSQHWMARRRRKSVNVIPRVSQGGPPIDPRNP